jgi:hypothetical protein
LLQEHCTTVVYKEHFKQKGLSLGPYSLGQEQGERTGTERKNKLMIWGQGWNI